MKLKKNALPALAVALGALLAGGAVLASGNTGENDAVADLAKARLTLSQAVSAAEGHALGKATKAELEGEKGAVVYKVEVVASNNKVFDVKVDAADGKVLSSTQDQADRGGRDEGDDD